MQYLDGLTLKDYLKKQSDGKMPFNMAVKAMIPIMDALKEVHKAGFVHRDISPDNIFITRQKQIKLLDFGAARYAIGEHSKSLTSVLKHGYAPVEQYSTKGNQGPWSDVYAVAATIYRCITGETPPDSMERLQDETIKSPKQLGVDIPLTAELALMKGLALKAADRYESVPEFQKALLEKSIQNSPSGQGEVVAPQRAETARSPETTTATKAESDNYRDYGSEATNYRLLGLKIVVGVFILLAVTYSLLSKKNVPTFTTTTAKANPARVAPQTINIDNRQPQAQPQPQPPTERVKVSSESYHSQALVLVKNKYFEDLRRLVDDWVKDNPGDYYAWYFDGLYYYSFQNYARASDSLRKSLQINPNNPDAHILLGDVSIAKGDYAGGLVILNQCLKYNQNIEEIYTSMAGAYYNLQSYDDAIDSYKKALKIKKSFSLYYNIGHIYLNFKANYREARKYYFESIKLNPNSTEALHGLGICLILMGDRNGTVECIKRLYELNDVPGGNDLKSRLVRARI